MSNETLAVQIPRASMNQAVCECGSTFFHLRYQVLCYRGLLTKGEPVVTPLPVYLCDNCAMIMAVDQKGFPVNYKPLKP